jgi:hypothetical protein
MAKLGLGQRGPIFLELPGASYIDSDVWAFALSVVERDAPFFIVA